MDKFEKLVNEIMAECEKDNEPITREEAEEMARQELGYKENVKNYVQSEKPRAKSTKERKVDTEKAELLGWLADALIEKGISPTTENEVKLHFNFNGSDYSVTLTKHRAKK